MIELDWSFFIEGMRICVTGVGMLILNDVLTDGIGSNCFVNLSCFEDGTSKMMFTCLLCCDRL